MTDSDERTAQYVKLVKQTVRQRLDCLIDSGAKLAEVRAVTQLFREAINTAYFDAYFDLIKELEGGGNDDS